MPRTCQQSPRAGGAFRKEGDMPIHEILTALWVSALAVDSATVIARLAKLCEAARGDGGRNINASEWMVLEK